MASVDSRSFYVVGDELDPQAEKATTELRKKNPNVLFVVARSCNLNLVVYEALIDPKKPTRLKESDPVDIYWLNLEKKYADLARKRRQPHDRDELMWPERKLAYGSTAKPSKKKPGTFKLIMNACPSLPIRVGIDTKSNKPKAYIRLDPTGKLEPGHPAGTLCFLERIYVNVIFKAGVLPDVDWLAYYGTDANTLEPVTHKVIRFKA